MKEFYRKMDEMMMMIKKSDITMIIGDLNAKIERSAEGDPIVAYDLGTRKNRSLVQFGTMLV